jgi:hypothetical protein
VSCLRSLAPRGLINYYRLAQWDGQSRKYYYVQRATGISTWDIPTQPAPSVPTPEPTPQQVGDPFPQPARPAQDGVTDDGRQKQDPPESYQGAERSFLTVGRAQCWTDIVQVKY